MVKLVVSLGGSFSERPSLSHLRCRDLVGEGVVSDGSAEGLILWLPWGTFSPSPLVESHVHEQRSQPSKLTIWSISKFSKVKYVRVYMW